MPVGAVQDEGDLRNFIRQELDRSMAEIIARSQNAGVANTFSSGDIKAGAYSTADTGWLLCDGTAVSRTTYSDLFAAIGTTWGTGDGSTTFNVPDVRGRALVGRGTGTGLTARALAAVFGAETHTLTSGESGLPAHNHSASSSVTDPGHTHGPNGSGSFVINTGSPAPTGSGTAGVDRLDSQTSSSTTGISVSTSVSNNGAANASGGHNNIQPSVAVSFFIKT